MAGLTLCGSIDRDALRAAFASQGHVRIARLLAADGAARLRDHVATRTDWRQVLNSGEKVFELDRPTRDAMAPEHRAALDDAVAAGAQNGFQYRFETVRVPDGQADREAAGDPLSRFASWLSRGEPRALIRYVTGASDIAFADAQATAYAHGDLLTAHDDHVAGKNRRAAYVFGLTPHWRPEWGGLLLFHHEHGRITGCAPGFNTLDLFAVPKVHSVSQVTRSAIDRRYAVTGWLRAEPGRA